MTPVPGRIACHRFLHLRASNHTRFPSREGVGGGVWVAALILGTVPWVGCRQLVDQTDRQVAAVIAQRQREALAYQSPAPVSTDPSLLGATPREVYQRNPNPRTAAPPPDFAGGAPHPPARGAPATPVLPGEEPAPAETPEPVPADTPEPASAESPASAAAPEAAPAPSPQPASVPAPLPPSGSATQPAAPPGGEVFTLIDALRYAHEHRRALQNAKEDLYLAALALTLERHLWTPTFASNLRTVYGNFGQIRDFDQAMRFVADLGLSQRLPYGGDFTAKAISTLIRDVKQSITASEGSSIELGLRVPFLRGAGHVAREQLVRLERELTYAVRQYERFRRRQMVEVARGYFDLLRAKQAVVDGYTTLERRADFLERARAFEATGERSPLETQRAEQDFLSAENALEDQRENFRAAADQFKILIGMPVDQPLGMEQLEDIEIIENAIAAGSYPLLLRPAAVDDEARALHVALENRLDLLTRKDQIDDARRGVAVARNGLLPDLDLNSTVTWNTDPDRYKLGAFDYDRTTWRSEVILGLPLERTRERNAFRAALIDVRRAQRNYQEQVEVIRAEVRSAVNQIRLQERALEIQKKNLEIADRRREFAKIQYDDGFIEIREWLDAEAEWAQARNRLNLAKTEGWTSLLRFRLSTETLRIDEEGVQAGED